MHGPCKHGVARDATGLTGREVIVGGAPAYLITPAKDIRKRLGVLLLHDIWGFNIPNAKYVADHMAQNGLPALLPNLYHGISLLDGWPGTEFDDGKALEGGMWDCWWTEITSGGYWQPFHARVADAVKLLKEEQGCAQVCIVGFCWGGLAIEQLSTTGVFAAAASVHGIHVDGWDSNSCRQCKFGPLSVDYIHPSVSAGR